MAASTKRRTAWASRGCTSPRSEWEGAAAAGAAAAAAERLPLPTLLQQGWQGWLDSPAVQWARVGSLWACVRSSETFALGWMSSRLRVCPPARLLARLPACLVTAPQESAAAEPRNLPDRRLMRIAGHALKANITTLGPLVLPISEQLLFFSNLVARKVGGQGWWVQSSREPGCRAALCRRGGGGRATRSAIVHT